MYPLAFYDGDCQPEGCCLGSRHVNDDRRTPRAVTLGLAAAGSPVSIGVLCLLDGAESSMT
jgi:hypothetical protein